MFSFCIFFLFLIISFDKYVLQKSTGFIHCNNNMQFKSYIHLPKKGKDL